MSKERWIIHADMDAFYASVEQRDNPQLRGQPVIVCRTGLRGVVSAASYEARQYGVFSAMSTVEARRRCPGGVFVSPEMGKYAEVSGQILQIFSRFSPTIETLALDEAFLDVGGMERLYGDVENIARAIKRQVKEELNLVVSVGAAANKFLAKLASALKKPDGLVIIRPGEELALLAPLDIKKLWGVGDVTARYLYSLGIKTIADLRCANVAQLEKRLGKCALELHHLAWGRDNRPVIPDREAKSIGNEDTYEYDLISQEQILTALLSLAERVGWRLRREKQVGRTITLKVRFSSFKTVTRSVTLATPSAVDEVLYEEARQMLDKVAIKEGIRLLGITASNFAAAGVQLGLFDEQTEKREKVAVIMDELKERFGRDIVKRGRLLQEKGE